MRYVYYNKMFLYSAVVRMCPIMYESIHVCFNYRFMFIRVCTRVFMNYAKLVTIHSSDQRQQVFQAGVVFNLKYLLYFVTSKPVAG